MDVRSLLIKYILVKSCWANEKQENIRLSKKSILTWKELVSAKIAKTRLTSPTWIYIPLYGIKWKLIWKSKGSIKNGAHNSKK